MKSKLLVFIFLQIYFSSFSQFDSETLVEIDDKKFSVADFKNIYEKNLELVTSKEDKDIDKNLKLFINYKLKVKEAYRLKLDTSALYINELNRYRNQLYTPYLKNQKILDSLLLEAYKRSKTEIRASHILIKFPKNSSAKDTLDTYTKIVKVRERILNGESFVEVAKEVSDDESVTSNGGDLGFFSVFKMVKEFEDIVYNTPKGNISKPFKTQFGYHIIKVVDNRPSLGERQVAHIMISGDKKKGKKKIDSVYNIIMAGGKFETLAKTISDDVGTKSKGGVMPKFESGKMILAFDKAAFSLKNIGDVSKPFETRFGWHLLKLLNIYPIQSFNDSKAELQKKIKQSGRYSISKDLLIKKLKKKYKVQEVVASQSIFKNKNIRTIANDSLKAVLFTINNKKYLQLDFVNSIKKNKRKEIADLYNNYLNSEILEFYKQNLINDEPEFASTLQEYKEGLLLFELIQQKIWKKASDSLSLANFYQSKKVNYKKPLESIKGTVINDYQKKLEKEWIANLNSNTKVVINKKALKKLKDEYAKKEK